MLDTHLIEVHLEFKDCNTSDIGRKLTKKYSMGLSINKIFNGKFCIQQWHGTITDGHVTTVIINDQTNE